MKKLLNTFYLIILLLAVSCNTDKKNMYIEHHSQDGARVAEIKNDTMTKSNTTKNDTIDKSKFIGKWINTRCNMTIDIKKKESKYFYILKTAKRTISHELNFYKDKETTHIVFKGIKWISKKDTLSKDLTALYEPESTSFVIQNYGNTMNDYLKLEEGCEKYMHFNKAKPIDTLNILSKAVSSIKGYHIIDWKKGDIDNDKQNDFVIVMESNKTYNEPLDSTYIRKVVLLKAKQFSNFMILGTNDHLVSCSTCGGAGVGDPFMGVTIKNGYFSIEQMFGACIKTYIVATFKYMKGNFYLQSIGTEDVYCNKTDESGDPKVTFSKQTKKDFGWIKFEDYSDE